MYYNFIYKNPSYLRVIFWNFELHALVVNKFYLFRPLKSKNRLHTQFVKQYQFQRNPKKKFQRFFSISLKNDIFFCWKKQKESM